MYDQIYTFCDLKRFFCFGGPSNGTREEWSLVVPGPRSGLISSPVASVRRLESEKWCTYMDMYVCASYQYGDFCFVLLAMMLDVEETMFLGLPHVSFSSLLNIFLSGRGGYKYIYPYLYVTSDFPDSFEPNFF